MPASFARDATGRTSTVSRTTKMNRRPEGGEGEAHGRAKRPVAAEPTPLSRSLQERSVPSKVTPLDAFELARSWWLAGERLDIGRLAKALGVGRATVFRWVGTREQLYGEVLAAVYTQELDFLHKTTEGHGPDRVAAVARRGMKRLARFSPLRRFIAQDPEFAIRVLTSAKGVVQRRCIELHRAWFQRLEEAGEIEPELDLDTLAYIIVRIGEAYLYGDSLSESESDLEKASAAIRILVAAKRA
jgi:AcrR family transcriptional regulator